MKTAREERPLQVVLSLVLLYTYARAPNLLWIGSLKACVQDSNIVALEYYYYQFRERKRRHHWSLVQLAFALGKTIARYVEVLGCGLFPLSLFLSASKRFIKLQKIVLEELMVLLL